MKKIIFILSAMAALLLGTAAQAYEMGMYVNDEYMDCDIQSVWGFDMLPILDIAPKIGFDCTYDGTTMVLYNDEQSYTFTVGDPSVYDKDGLWHGLEVVPAEIGGKLRIPANFLQEEFGLEYVWDAYTNLLFLNSEMSYNAFAGITESNKNIASLIITAQNELGYLEKQTNASLYDKTENAGVNNYTKYWAEIMPEYQAQPWCACFVTWCYVQSFGTGSAKTLLKHYPYVYCPTMSYLFNLKDDPQVGDVVIFKYGSVFAHTGIVIATGPHGYFTTIEGNAVDDSSGIKNGGAVTIKHYHKKNLPGTKFCRPDYSILSTENE
ncbi:MAG: CHAP domain-containing protein [Clostridiales bacterium]|nr:CHAP domain-containing protein [Clostridiales bacterium]